MKGIGLIRVSTAEQANDDHAGVPAQRYAISQISARHGIEIVQTFEIADVSGTQILLAPEFQQLLVMLRDPAVTAVVAKEFQRLMRPRNLSDYAIIDAFRENNVTLYLADGVIDFRDRFGRLQGLIKGEMSEWERQDIVSRTMSAKEEMRRQGKHPSAKHTLPRGVTFDKKAGWSYTEEIEQVKEVFRLFLAGNHNLADISRQVSITRSTVRNVLGSRAYLGQMVYDTKHDLSPAGYVPRPDGRQGYRKKVRRSPEEIITVNLPMEPLITEEQFRYIQTILERRRKNFRHRIAATGPQFAYNGFLWCGDCKENCYTHQARLGTFFYVCSSRPTVKRRKRASMGLEPCSNRYMSRDRLEAKINHVLRDRLTQPSFLESAFEGFAKQADQVAAPNEELIRAKIEANFQRRKRVIDLYVSGHIDAGDRDRRLMDLDTETAGLESIAKLKPRDRSLDFDKLVDSVAVFNEWDWLQRDQKRELLSSLVPQIFVYKYMITGLVLSCDIGNRLQTSVDVTIPQFYLAVNE